MATDRKVIKKPHVDDLKRISDRYGLQCSADELRAFANISSETFNTYQRISDMQEPRFSIVDLARSTNSRLPTADENPYGAWYWKCEIQVAGKSSPIAGKQVAVKDNVAVAGIPMMNGSRTIEGFVPDFDATVVTRLLDAGAVIAGKSVCEDLCLSGASWNTAVGPVQNPWRPDATFSAGGSSSGSAVLVACGDVDIALGGDQGGSIRIPASSCGIVGLKPTHGLVPYTGIMSIEATVDHVGPMARTVLECAQMLDVIAGSDNGLDPRQPINLVTRRYALELSKGAGDLKVGVVQEGFALCDVEVVKCVTKAVEVLCSSKKFGSIQNITVPEHRGAADIVLPILFEGTVKTLIDGYGFGGNMKGYQPTAFCDKLREGLKEHAKDLSVSAKAMILQGAYSVEEHGQHFYSKAQSLVVALRRQYDKHLENCDLLLMPTLQHAPAKADFASIEDRMTKSLGMIGNTCPFNGTGHPAISINAGYSSEGLPIGLMLVGRHFDDDVVLRAAFACETALKHLQRPFPSLISAHRK